MSRKGGYIFVTIITVVLIHPTVTFHAKLVQPGAVNPARPTYSAVINLHQEPDSKQVQKNSQDRIVINTKLVNLTVTVNDKLGRFVTGLTKEDFEIFDDNVKQDIAFFSDDDAPISLGIVYDVSGSMGN